MSGVFTDYGLPVPPDVAVTHKASERELLALDAMIDAGLKASNLLAVANEDIIMREHLRAFMQAALRDAADAPAWQPIETAPRDGTRCDVWAVYTDAYGSSAERYTNARFDEEKASWVDGWNNLLDWSELDEKDDMKPRGRKTTHWMPRPAPPLPRPERGTTTGGA